MKTWTVFSPYFFPANPAVLLHASLLDFLDLLDLQCGGPRPVNTQCAVKEENRTTSPGSWMQYAICSRNCSKSSRSVLGRERSFSNGGTMRFLQRVFTSRVRVVKNHNFLPLSSWLTMLPPGLESMCQPVHAQPPLARSETCSMECPPILWTTSTYCSPSGSGCSASYRQGASGRPSKAASFIRVPLKVARSCFSLRKQTATLLAAPLV